MKPMSNRRDESSLLTTSQVARLLGVHAATVGRWVDQGRLMAFVTPGGHRRIPSQEVERLWPDSRAART